MSRKGKRKIAERAKEKRPERGLGDKEILERLLSWYRTCGRELPWRETRDPYEIWVSEVVLQQTQVSRGQEYYHRFLERFPDIFSLASARWSSVLKAWRGLGYYNRAKNMMKTAKLIVREFGGEFPKETKELLALPGIGPYTASAIQSFAFGKSVPAIDTNLNRIFQRLYGCPASQVGERAEALFQLKPRSARKINSALMDLGSLVCSARKPRCEECPLAKNCDYFRSGRGEEKSSSSLKQRAQKQNRIDVAVGCIHRSGEYLLGKRSNKKGGKWEFPGGKREKGESIRSALKREIKEELGIEVSVRPPFFIQSFTDNQFEWRIHFCRCQILAGKEKSLEHDEIRWVSKKDLIEIEMPSSNRVAVEKLSRMR